MSQFPREFVFQNLCHLDKLFTWNFDVESVANRRRYGHNSTVSKIVTTKWIKVNDLLNVQYSAKKNIRFKTPMLRSELCDYSNVYIAVKRTIMVDSTNGND